MIIFLIVSHFEFEKKYLLNIKIIKNKIFSWNNFMVLHETSSIKRSLHQLNNFTGIIMTSKRFPRCTKHINT